MEAPEFYQNATSFCPQLVPEKRQYSSDNKTVAGDHFVVEEFLDFSNEDTVIADAAAFDAVAGNSTDSSTVTVIDSCNSSNFSGCEPNFLADIGGRNFADGQFSSELCVPYDDLAELEWVSNFVEESFSSEDLQRLQLISGLKARNGAVESSQPETNRNDIINNNNGPILNSDHVSVPAKARSKRSRAPPCNWTSRLLLVSATSSSSSSPEQDVVVSVPPPPPTTLVAKKTVKAAASRKKEADPGPEGGAGAGEGRKCLHCATDKTPQWRTGPMGPKTLCNACGVRYKSGRLVPEYRPAASPTFVLTKHSNSHRKVLELRRQKEFVRAQQHGQHQQQQFIPHHHHHQNGMVYDSSSNGEDYLIHQHVGPDFRQMI